MGNFMFYFSYLLCRSEPCPPSQSLRATCPSGSSQRDQSSSPGPLSTPTQVLALSLVRYVDQYTGTRSLLLVRYVDRYTGTRSLIGHICLPIHALCRLIHRYSLSYWSDMSTYTQVLTLSLFSYMPTNTLVLALSYWSDMSTNTQVIALSLVIYAYQYTLSHWSDMSANTQVLALLLVRYV
jgi:hypothetical protein